MLYLLRLKTILQSSHLILLLLIITIVYSLIYSYLPRKSKYNLDETIIKGTLLSKSVDGDKLTIVIKGEEKVKCTYYIKNYKDVKYYENIPLGTTLTLTGTLNIPNKNTIPNTFNYYEYLYYQGINFTMNINNIKVNENNIFWMYKLKNALINHIAKYRSKAYLLTFILGDKSALEEGIYEGYQSIGVSHIFAISGMHVSLLTGIILKLLKKLKENTRYVIVIIFLLIYSFLTDFQPSILRSITLFILLFLNKRFSFNLNTLRVYYLTITVLLLSNPYLIHNVGFQYSSVVSYSLIRNSKLIKGSYLMKCLKISLIAFLYSLPITACNNYEINILSVFNNLIYVPLISFIIYPISLLTLLFPFLDNVLLSLNHISEFIANYMLILNIIIPKIPSLIIVAYYILITLFFNSYRKIFLLISLILIMTVKIYPFLDNNYYVYFLDVGQGDSTVIKYKGETIMIDTGGKVSFKIDAWKEKKKTYLTDNTMRFLKSIGVSKIDYLILTHGDTDHLGEAEHLVDNFKVLNIILNKGEFNSYEKSLLKKKVNITNKYYGSLNLRLLDTDIIYDNENDNSIVTLLNINNYRLLFMGDASIKVETDLLKKYKLSTNLIKVGHHGSKTSSDYNFLKSINPSIAIISSGRNNRYNHPNKETLETLDKLKVNYFNTQTSGTIKLTLGKRITYSEFPP